MHRALLIACLALSLPAPSAALTGTWATDAAVGPSEVDFTLDLSCPAPTFTCSLIDGYSDVQTSTLSTPSMLSASCRTCSMR